MTKPIFFRFGQFYISDSLAGDDSQFFWSNPKCDRQRWKRSCSRMSGQFSRTIQGNKQEVHIWYYRGLCYQVKLTDSDEK